MHKLFVATVLYALGAVRADTVTLSIVAQPFRSVSNLLYSAFIEDINHAVVGGLHSEMLSDTQMTVGFASNAAARVSLGALAQPRYWLRYCFGELLLSMDGTGDATFELQQPGLDGSPNSASFVSLSAPNTGAVIGEYLVAGTKGLLEAAADGSAAFNTSATFLLEPGANSSVYALRTHSGAYVVALDAAASSCSWLGTTYSVGLVNASSAPSAAYFSFESPLQPIPNVWWLDAGVNGTIAAPPTPLNANLTVAMALTVASPAGAGVCNTGFYGINVTASADYLVSVWVLLPQSSDFSAVIVTLEDDSGSNSFAQATWQISSSGSWQHLNATLHATGSASGSTAARACFRLQGSGTGWMAAPSLQPAATFRGRVNGLRPDLAHLLADMQPAALRFPGGCFVEGISNATAYNFTQTIGPTSTRPSHYNLWQYQSNDFMGFYEYLVLTEDIGAEPIWVVNVGLVYGGGSSDVQPWIDHALASLEFAMGDTSTYWGGLRAAMGHPAPFAIRFVGVGNENSGSIYVQHYLAVYQAIKAVYPSMMLIANEDLGSSVAALQGAPLPDQLRTIWKGPASFAHLAAEPIDVGSVTNIPVDVYDYHVYPSADYFFANQDAFDAVNRSSSPLIFNSEYAVKAGGAFGNLRAALGEAAWMTGLERNSDLVVAACYAPLFVSLHDRNWLPDAIVFDGSAAYGTPSYLNQKLFSTNTAPGSVLLPFNATSSPLSAEPARVTAAGVVAATNFSASVTQQAVAGQVVVVLKLVSYASFPRNITVAISGLAPGQQQPSQGVLQTITCPASAPSCLDAENTLDAPDFVSITSTTVSTSPGSLVLLSAYSISVLRMVVSGGVL